MARGRSLIHVFGHPHYEPRAKSNLASCCRKLGGVRSFEVLFLGSGSEKTARQEEGTEWSRADLTPAAHQLPAPEAPASWPWPATLSSNTSWAGRRSVCHRLAKGCLRQKIGLWARLGPIILQRLGPWATQNCYGSYVQGMFSKHPLSPLPSLGCLFSPTEVCSRGLTVRQKRWFGGGLNAGPATAEALKCPASHIAAVPAAKAGPRAHTALFPFPKCPAQYQAHRRSSLMLVNRIKRTT